MKAGFRQGVSDEEVQACNMCMCTALMSSGGAQGVALWGRSYEVGFVKAAFTYERNGAKAAPCTEQAKVLLLFYGFQVYYLALALSLHPPPSLFFSQLPP